MTDFHVPTEAYHELPAEIHSDGNADGVTGYDGLIDLVRRDLTHDGWYDVPTDHDGAVDRLSYDLDGDGHFDLVKDDDTGDGDIENSFRY